MSLALSLRKSLAIYETNILVESDLVGGANLPTHTGGCLWFSSVPVESRGTGGPSRRSLQRQDGFQRDSQYLFTA